MHDRKSTLHNAILACAIMTVVAGTAFVLPANARTMHLRLDRAEPAIDTTITKAPTDIRLHFSEAVKAPLTAVKLTGPDSVLVALEPLTLGDGKIAPVIAKLKGTMKPGVQRVDWRTQGADGHVLTGTFRFTLKAP
jgi:copper resistance protein C